MPDKRSSKKAQPAKPAASPRRAARPSALLDTGIIYCGECLDQLAKQCPEQQGLPRKEQAK